MALTFPRPTCFDGCTNCDVCGAALGDEFYHFTCDAYGSNICGHCAARPRAAIRLNISGWGSMHDQCCVCYEYFSGQRHTLGSSQLCEKCSNDEVLLKSCLLHVTPLRKFVQTDADALFPADEIDVKNMDTMLHHSVAPLCNDEYVQDLVMQLWRLDTGRPDFNPQAWRLLETFFDIHDHIEGAFIVRVDEPSHEVALVIRFWGVYCEMFRVFPSLDAFDDAVGSWQSEEKDRDLEDYGRFAFELCQNRGLITNW